MDFQTNPYQFSSILKIYGQQPKGVVDEHPNIDYSVGSMAREQQGFPGFSWVILA
jgi:hypothetical protein